MKKPLKCWVIACASFAFLFFLARVASAMEFQSRYNPQPRDPAVEALIRAGETAASAGKPLEAERDYKRAESDCLFLKKNNQDQLADILSLLSKLYRSQKKFDLAILYANKLSTQERKMYGPDNILIAEDFKTLGDIQREAGRKNAAEASFRQAIALASPADARQFNSCSVAQSSNNSRKLTLINDCFEALTDCLEQDNNLDGAEDVYQQAIDQDTKIKDLDTFWNRDHMSQRYIKFLERNERDASKAKEQLAHLRRMHELNHEFSPGELDSH